MLALVARALVLGAALPLLFGCGSTDDPGADGASSVPGGATANGGSPPSAGSAGGGGTPPTNGGSAGGGAGAGAGSTPTSSADGGAPSVGGDAGRGDGSSEATDGAAGGSSSGAADGSTTPAGPTRGERIVIPITVISDGSEEPVVLVDVSIGGSAPFQAIVDTGAAGLRVADGIVPDSAWQVTTTALAPETFPANHDTVSALLANASITLGGVSVPTPVRVGRISGVSCLPSDPGCVAAGQTAASFRFRNKYPANIGLGMRANDLASPLASIAVSGKYILSLPRFDDGSTIGSIIVDPDATDIARFLEGQQLSAAAASNVPGVTAWIDNQVPFCINGFCDVGAFDSGEGGGECPRRWQRRRRVPDHRQRRGDADPRRCPRDRAVQWKLQLHLHGDGPSDGRARPLQPVDHGEPHQPGHHAVLREGRALRLPGWLDRLHAQAVMRAAHHRRGFAASTPPQSRVPRSGRSALRG